MFKRSDINDMENQTHQEFAAYLRRLAADYADSGSEYTAQDLNEAADRIEELAAAIAQHQHDAQ